MAKSALNKEQKIRVSQLAGDGFSQSKIAKLFDVSQGTISNVLKEKHYEDEIARKDQMIQNAMQYAVESAIEKGDLTPSSKLLKG